MERELNKLFNDTNYNKENVIIREIWSIKLELQNFFWGVYIIIFFTLCWIDWFIAEIKKAVRVPNFVEIHTTKEAEIRQKLQEAQVGFPFGKMQKPQSFTNSSTPPHPPPPHQHYNNQWMIPSSPWRPFVMDIPTFVYPPKLFNDVDQFWVKVKTFT